MTTIELDRDGVVVVVDDGLITSLELRRQLFDRSRWEETRSTVLDVVNDALAQSCAGVMATLEAEAFASNPQLAEGLQQAREFLALLRRRYPAAAEARSSAPSETGFHAESGVRVGVQDLQITTLELPVELMDPQHQRLAERGVSYAVNQAIEAAALAGDVEPGEHASQENGDSA